MAAAACPTVFAAVAAAVAFNAAVAALTLDGELGRECPELSCVVGDLDGLLGRKGSIARRNAPQPGKRRRAGTQLCQSEELAQKLVDRLAS